jgi:3-hydroxyisobutyrate dehydrogenase-like beta-hydroxyacid dehydrogenase
MLALEEHCHACEHESPAEQHRLRISKSMTTVSVLGLGRLGTAVTSALIDAGITPSVWNRNVARAYAFEGRARIATNPENACAASEIIVLCVSDYAASMEVLDAAADAELADRTLVQLTSGTPSDARTLQAWCRMHRMHYLDGAIIGQTDAVGTGAVIAFYSGEESAFERYRSELAALGNACYFLGEAAGAAAALECALLEYYYGATLAMLHGAALCESENIPLTHYFKALKNLDALNANTAETARAMIDRENYYGLDRNLKTHLAQLRHIQRLSHDNEVEPRLPDTLMQIYKKAISAGHGTDAIAAAFEVLRSSKDSA